MGWRGRRGSCGRWRMSSRSFAAANCDRAQVPTRGDSVRCATMRALTDIPDVDDLAGLTWYYWLLVERVRSVNATAEELQPLLARIELWFRDAKRRCSTYRRAQTVAWR